MDQIPKKHPEYMVPHVQNAQRRPQPNAMQKNNLIHFSYSNPDESEIDVEESGIEINSQNQKSEKLNIVTQ